MKSKTRKNIFTVQKTKKSLVMAKTGQNSKQLSSKFNLCERDRVSYAPTSFKRGATVDPTEFQQVIKKKSFNKKPSIKPIEPTTTSNQFETLSNDEMEIGEVSDSNKEYRPSLAKGSKEPANVRVKPIFLWNTSHDDVKKLKADLTLNSKSNFERLRAKDAFQFFASSKAEKKLVRDHLDSQKIQYHTYTEPEDRHTVYVLKKFVLMETEKLVKALNEANIPAKQATLISKNVNSPVYRVSFTKNEVDINMLMNQHRLIDSLRVTWEKLAKTSQKPTQCKNCQAWGHSAINCKRQYRCMKCLEPHLPGQCKRTLEDAQNYDTPPSCVNCGQIGHLSSNYNCPVFKRYESKAHRRNELHQPRRFNSTPAPWASQIEYNEAAFPSLNAPVASQSFMNGSGESHPVSQVPVLQNNSTFNKPNSYAQIEQLRDDFDSIPGMNGAIKILKTFQQKLFSLKGNEQAMASEIFKFISIKP